MIHILQQTVLSDIPIQQKIWNFESKYFVNSYDFIIAETQFPESSDFDASPIVLYHRGANTLASIPMPEAAALSLAIIWDLMSELSPELQAALVYKLQIFNKIIVQSLPALQVFQSHRYI